MVNATEELRGLEMLKTETNELCWCHEATELESYIRFGTALSYRQVHFRRAI